ncbi:MAG: hypothetical protein GHCLOJNM_03394 [bacterium]|nr:hypothetical protein [bacterium]
MCSAVSSKDGGHNLNGSKPNRTTIPPSGPTRSGKAESDARDGAESANPGDVARIELVELLLRPEAVEEVLRLLEALGIEVFSLGHVQGAGRQRGHTEIFRGREYAIETRPKVRLEVLVESIEQREQLIRQVRDTVYTGHVGDGKVFVMSVENPKTERMAGSARGDD